MRSANLLSIALLSAVPMFALAQGGTAPNTLPPVQAPPGINDPGVSTAPPPATATRPAPADATAAAAAPTADDKPVDSPGLPAEVQAAAEATELPVVTVRQQGSDTVEEYRKRGKLYFVRVLSSSGAQRFYVDDPNAVPADVMKQLSGPSGVVQPVYFKLVDWGKPSQ